jgi:D-3-phosphoglycerate dehydrogenase
MSAPRTLAASPPGIPPKSRRRLRLELARGDAAASPTRPQRRCKPQAQSALRSPLSLVRAPRYQWSCRASMRARLAQVTARRAAFLDGVFMATNRSNKKTILATESLAQGGWRLLRARSDVEAIAFRNPITARDLEALLAARAPVHGIALGITPFGDKAIAAAGSLAVVARIGVGYDAVDVPALTRRRIPLMVAGSANSPSVAEQAMYMMLTLAKRGAELDRMVKSGAWTRRWSAVPIDLTGKTVLIVGFGRIGTRIAKRCRAMEMNVLVYDPYVATEHIKSADCEPVADLDAALPRADFVTIHCPKTPETIAMFNTARLERMQPTAYLVNTARGGIIDEAALNAALTTGKLAGAGLDVFADEPPDPAHPLLKLANVIAAPHMAGVTRESLERMGLETARNILSALDGSPTPENVVNREVLG